MRVLILKGTNADGEKREVGKEYDISDRDARILIGSKKAVEVVDEKTAKAEEKDDKKPAKSTALNSKTGPR